MRHLGTTDLEVHPLCLGANVFGWTASRRESFRILDAYAAAGGNFIDTADQYAAWVTGNVGGESEDLIGRWMAARGCRDRFVVATKVGKAPGLEGLSEGTIRRAVEGSLKRLRTDHIDLYFAHLDDAEIPLTETLAAMTSLVQDGKVRYLAASNYSATRLLEALAVSKRNGLESYVAVQTHYNLVHRHEFEGRLREVCAADGLVCLPYYALASGFLTGKYDGISPQAGNLRAELAFAHVNPAALEALARARTIAATHQTSIASVALAWLAAQPGVAVPIASARTTGQLEELLRFTDLQLTREELRALTDVEGLSQAS